MSGEDFSRVGVLLEELVGECRTLAMDEGNITDCAELLERLKTAGIAMDGLGAALIGRVIELQCKDAAESGWLRSGR